MSKIQQYLNYIADSRARRSLRSILSNFIDDSDNMRFKIIDFQSDAKSAAAYAATGTAWADGGTPVLVADQAYLKIKIAGTTYRLPLFADS